MQSPQQIVGHDADRCHAAVGSGPGAGSVIFLKFLARLADMGMEVYHPGQDEFSGGIQLPFCAASRQAADAGDLFSDDTNIGWKKPFGGVDVSVLDQ